MQTVFGVSAVTLLVPVAYHLQRTSEASSLDPNAPGMHHVIVSTFGGVLQSALLTSQAQYVQTCLDAFQNRPSASTHVSVRRQILVKLYPRKAFCKHNLQESICIWHLMQPCGVLKCQAHI